MRASETLDGGPLEGPTDDGSTGDPVPGLVLLFSGDRPAFGVIPLAGGALVLGRGEVAGVRIDDKRMSREHARVAFDGRRFAVRDLDSRNGTAVDGEELRGERAGEALRIVRMGSSLFLLAADTRPYRAGLARGEDMVMGPLLQRTFRTISRAARFGRVLHITGESGSGKELAARAFHAAGPTSAGPFVAVNGATLPEGMAERLLFGARRGAYTGAVDALGYVQSAHGGTLFLDEVAELDPGVQAKLLRVLEAGEVLPLGELRPARVDVRLCSATLKDLRAQVAAGKLREDLYFRIGVPAVTLPPLRERPEEIPWLLDRAVQQVRAAVGAPRGAGPGDEAALWPHTSLVEACLLRRWPGNVRELLAEVRAAAQIATEEGGAVLARHLSPTAGMAVVPPPSAEPSPRAASPSDAPGASPAASSAPPGAAPGPAPAEAREAREARAARPSGDEIAAALRAAGGNISAAARALGLHRTQLKRWMAQPPGGTAERPARKQRPGGAGDGA
ncbi:sigma 54-interacting transcriptional regulator [Sorangium sp. So ce131]|uniref:sigma 54-interacting transcriptional regulator n=1 Tax=Sorangium sp. So ce131 TaxID=3133282 RepID=UPI003F636C7E